MVLFRWQGLVMGMLLLVMVGCSPESASEETETEATATEQAVVLPDGDQPILSDRPSSRPTPLPPFPLTDATPASEGTEPAASASLPDPEWITIQGNGVGLSLPPDYTGGNPGTEFAQLKAKLNQISPSYAQRFAAIEENPEAIALLAFDGKNTAAGFLTNVTIAAERVLEPVVLEDYVRAASSHLSQAYEIESQGLLQVGAYPAGQIIGVITADNDVKVKQLFYLIQAADTFWIVTYATPVSEFEQRLPQFQQSIQTLKLSF
ncbi:hypothetical protein VB712_14965 [Spirulina sp. CCNP1310]|uniref:hypothetical protein n=1 Tax=Spirulina sp. CCNP1310 TaxID=3110249 RepID=UPI002B22039D|nr:hypothetical protein [Spirulina sp. CCNP1310]MEA5420532.1 hypothetical protein [Spirulina sp. CCNP1310]